MHLHRYLANRRFIVRNRIRQIQSSFSSFDRFGMSIKVIGIVNAPSIGICCIKGITSVLDCPLSGKPSDDASGL